MGERSEPDVPWRLTFALGRPGALDLKGLEVMGSQLIFTEHSIGTSLAYVFVPFSVDDSHL